MWSRSRALKKYPEDKCEIFLIGFSYNTVVNLSHKLYGSLENEFRRDKLCQSATSLLIFREYWHFCGVLFQCQKFRRFWESVKNHLLSPQTSTFLNYRWFSPSLAVIWCIRKLTFFFPSSLVHLFFSRFLYVSCENDGWRKGREKKSGNMRCF